MKKTSLHSRTRTLALLLLALTPMVSGCGVPQEVEKLKEALSFIENTEIPFRAIAFLNPAILTHQARIIAMVVFAALSIYILLRAIISVWTSVFSGEGLWHALWHKQLFWLGLMYALPLPIIATWLFTESGAMIWQILDVNFRLLRFALGICVPIAEEACDVSLPNPGSLASVAMITGLFFLLLRIYQLISVITLPFSIIIAALVRSFKPVKAWLIAFCSWLFMVTAWGLMLRWAASDGGIGKAVMFFFDFNHQFINTGTFAIAIIGVNAPVLINGYMMFKSTKDWWEGRHDNRKDDGPGALGKALGMFKVNVGRVNHVHDVSPFADPNTIYGYSPGMMPRGFMGSGTSGYMLPDPDNRNPRYPRRPANPPGYGGDGSIIDTIEDSQGNFAVAGHDAKGDNPYKSDSFWQADVPDPVERESGDFLFDGDSTQDGIPDPRRDDGIIELHAPGDPGLGEEDISPKKRATQVVEFFAEKAVSGPGGEILVQAGSTFTPQDNGDGTYSLDGQQLEEGTVRKVVRELGPLVAKAAIAAA